jgi:hypothetical protein
MVPLSSISDTILLFYVQKLLQNSAAEVTLIDMEQVIAQNPEIQSAIHTIQQNSPHRLSTLDEQILIPDFLDKQDLMLVSLDSWEKMIGAGYEWLAQTPSTLLLKP